MIVAERSFYNEVLSGQERFLIYGGCGWIGGQLVEMLKERQCEFKISHNRLENRESVSDELDEYCPTHVLNAAGVTGRPSVDWCESHKVETIRANVIGTLNLADLCNQRKIHCTIYATGCIYEYVSDKKVFTEEDVPNFKDSFYSWTKGFVDEMLGNFNVLVLRIRMPISGDFHPRNFLTKISNYPKVHSVPNSMTVLFDLLPVSLVMAVRGILGKYNFVNPGVITHKECLDLHKRCIDPDHNYELLGSKEKLAELIRCGRSNNELSVDKLIKVLVDIYIPPIYESVNEATKRRYFDIQNKK